MIGLFGLIGVALAQCDVQLPTLAGGERWSGVLTVKDAGADCRQVDLGSVTTHRIAKLKVVIRQWDDGRMRFGRERLERIGERWVLELPEWREGDALKVKVSLEHSATDPMWAEPREVLSPADRIHARWSVEGEPVFGVDGNVSLETTQRWDRLAGPGVFAVFVPSKARGLLCRFDSQDVRETRSYGCALRLSEGEVGSFTVTWVEDGVGLSREWFLEEGQALSFTGATVSAHPRVSADGGVNEPGSVVVHLDEVGGSPVEAVALEEVELAARLVSIPEPGLGLRFKGRQLDDVLVRDILSLVQAQVQNGSRAGGHPLKARPLMEVRRSGWATPWEQALLLSRYLGQVKLDARAFPVRPAASGRAVVGAPEGYTRAVVRVAYGEDSFWLEPSCRSCSAGEISPDLWGGQVFSSVRDEMPEGPQSRR